ncbi:DUF839 domain-containing protein, partial [bacterium]|nr:DUF839 domain-containing protein [bacterium]
MTLDRRKFIATGVLTTFVSAFGRANGSATGVAGKNEMRSEQNNKSERTPKKMGIGDPRRKMAFTPLPYTAEDELSVAEGFTWYPILKAGDVINASGDRAGDCCDYLHFMPGKSSEQAFLWVNHEYLLDNVLYGKNLKAEEKSKEQVDAEMKMVGGSYVELMSFKHTDGSRRWKLKSDSQLAFRLDANSPIPLVGPAGGRTVLG